MKGRAKAIGQTKGAGGGVLYEASFLIDPALGPDRQSYPRVEKRVVGRKGRRFRSELELPIALSLGEMDKGGIYGRLAEAMPAWQGEGSPGRLILDISIHAEKFDGAELVADLNSLFLRFATRLRDAGENPSESVVRPSYRLELSTGLEQAARGRAQREFDQGKAHRPGGNRLKSANGDELLAPSSRAVYCGREETEPSAVAVGNVAEELEEQPGERVNAALEELFAGLPDDPRARLDAVVALQRAFRREAAKQLQPSINQILKTPPEAFAEKQQIASDLNNAFRELGLAARDKDITQPCNIVPLKSQRSKYGWLKLQTKKAPRLRSGPSTELDGVELIEAVREEPLGRGR